VRETPDGDTRSQALPLAERARPTATPPLIQQFL
jgi:hypothetical protein